MEILITASIGLFAVDRKYYLQIITADEYQFYYVEIDRTIAQIISSRENLAMESLDELPEGILLNEN